jgi:hypothetical protein
MQRNPFSNYWYSLTIARPYHPTIFPSRYRAVFQVELVWRFNRRILSRLHNRLDMFVEWANVEVPRVIIVINANDETIANRLWAGKEAGRSVCFPIDS